MVQIGMSSKPLSKDDAAKYPKVQFKPVHIGEDAVAMIVSKDVWDGGVRELSKEQLKGIYEGKITNWKDVGGKPQRIAFFNKEPGRGTWEVFVHWIYGSSKAAPQVSFPRWAATKNTQQSRLDTWSNVAAFRLVGGWKKGVRRGAESGRRNGHRADPAEYRRPSLSTEPPAVSPDQWRTARRGKDVRGFHAQ
jgi:phosphate transport system substrate-binding protein